jgi:DNA invertase Pin-like site-specific DNA recombinase
MPGPKTKCKHYAGCGCHYFPCCFECSLPECIYDVAGKVQSPENIVRNIDIIGMKEGGQSAKSISREFGISSRTVYRIIGNVNGS